LTTNWILFDCFNTLVDDFDQAGSIDGLTTIQHLPVEAGVFASVEAFRLAYTQSREMNWWQDDSEVHLDVRLEALFRKQENISDQDVAVLVTQMLDLFSVTYIDTIRLTSGVEAMLKAWAPIAKLGVVSNFFLPGWPKKFLEQLDLADYFEFVIDSAELNSKKPEAPIYQTAINMTGVEPDKILFVGDDFLRDVERPRELGMKARHYCRFGERPGVNKSPETDPIKHWDSFRP
tara:strand:- start:615 stop:1313 length:699 start_codon:yes stop_codon:yes gene_type:complete